MSLAIASGFWPRPSRLSRPLLTASRKKKIVIHSFGSPLALATLALRCAFGRLCRLAFPFFIMVIIIMLWRAALPAFPASLSRFRFLLTSPHPTALFVPLLHSTTSLFRSESAAACSFKSLWANCNHYISEILSTAYML